MYRHSPGHSWPSLPRSSPLPNSGFSHGTLVTPRGGGGQRSPAAGDANWLLPAWRKGRGSPLHVPRRGLAPQGVEEEQEKTTQRNLREARRVCKLSLAPPTQTLLGLF